MQNDNKKSKDWASSAITLPSSYVEAVETSTPGISPAPKKGLIPQPIYIYGYEELTVLQDAGHYMCEAIYSYFHGIQGVYRFGLDRSEVPT